MGKAVKGAYRNSGSFMVPCPTPTLPRFQKAGVTERAELGCGDWGEKISSTESTGYNLTIKAIKR